jgi:hypothetical protein
MHTTHWGSITMHITARHTIIIINNSSTTKTNTYIEATHSGIISHIQTLQLLHWTLVCLSQGHAMKCTLQKHARHSPYNMHSLTNRCDPIQWDIKGIVWNTTPLPVHICKIDAYCMTKVRCHHLLHRHCSAPKRKTEQWHNYDDLQHTK